MKNEFQTILDEINTAVQRENVKNAEEARKEQDARNRYELALMAKQTALNAGNQEQYKAAGLTAEEARLDVEFFEKFKAMNRKTPGETREVDARIRAALQTEAQRVKIDALAQLRQIFTEAVTVANTTLAKLSEIETTAKKWDTVVMKKTSNTEIIPAGERLTLSQFGSVANGQLQRFTLLKGV